VTKFEEIRSRLHKVRRELKGYKARCPAHADKHPSLSLREENGKILIKCFAGCPTPEVMAAIGMHMKDLSPESPPRARHKKARTSCIVAEYPYVDETGKLLFQVLRMEPKDFRQRRRDPKRKGWIWDMTGVRRVLYCLPEVIAAELVLICEGEKDCDKARALGFTATCNPGGAGKWRPEFNDFVRRKRVVIIPDADEVGRKHAQEVAASLNLRASSIKVLDLQGAKDLSEWIERGGTREKLVGLIQDRAEWAGNDETQKGFRLTSLRDLMLEPEEQVTYLLAGKLPAGGLSILSAKPKVGKSTFARGLCLAAARGAPFLDCATIKGPVIYLALEEKRSEVSRHFRDLGATGEEPIFIHAASAPQDAISELRAAMERVRPVLLVIDPLFKFVRVRDEKAYAEVSRAIEPLMILARESGTHVLATHHNGKMERPDAMDAILGSTAIFGGVDSAIILRKTDRYRTIQSSQRYGTDWPELVLNYDPVERSVSLGVEKSEADTAKTSEAIIAYLVVCVESQTRIQIEEHVGGKTSHLRSAIKSLIAAGRLLESGGGVKGDPLRYELNSSGGVQAGGDPEKCEDSCSHTGAGTREQESQNGAEDRTNTGDIVVPASSGESVDNPGSREQERGRSRQGSKAKGKRIVEVEV
jgi:hypothetical protein